MKGIRHKSTFGERCTKHRRCDDIEEKLDRIISMLEKMTGLRGFGNDLLANLVGNIITRG